MFSYKIQEISNWLDNEIGLDHHPITIRAVMNELVEQLLIEGY